MASARGEAEAVVALIVFGIMGIPAAVLAAFATNAIITKFIMKNAPPIVLTIVWLLSFALWVYITYLSTLRGALRRKNESD
jgi:hypothetical protein